MANRPHHVRREENARGELEVPVGNKSKKGKGKSRKPKIKEIRFAETDESESDDWAPIRPTFERFRIDYDVAHTLLSHAKRGDKGFDMSIAEENARERLAAFENFLKGHEDSHNEVVPYHAVYHQTETAINDALRIYLDRIEAQFPGREWLTEDAFVEEEFLFAFLPPYSQLLREAAHISFESEPDRVQFIHAQLISALEGCALQLMMSRQHLPYEMSAAEKLLLWGFKELVNQFVQESSE